MFVAPYENEIEGHSRKQEQPGEKQRVDDQEDEHPDDTHPSSALEQKEQGRGHDEGKGDGEHPDSGSRNTKAGGDFCGRVGIGPVLRGRFIAKRRSPCVSWCYGGEKPVTRGLVRQGRALSL